MAELTQRARAVAAVLSARVPEGSRQPVPYTILSFRVRVGWAAKLDVLQGYAPVSAI
jgi:hypothetical protein